MANTIIQLKYSNVTSQPPTLNVAEPAYSNVSNILWIDDGSGVVAIGGKFYTEIIDDANNLAIGNTLVKRDTNGNSSFNFVFANNITGNITGTASQADKITTARDIGLAGDATGNVLFDGSQNVTLTVDLTETGVSSGTYGGTTKIPVFTVDSEGRLTYAANADVATTLSYAGDSGSTGNLNLLTDIFTIEGRDGITTAAFDANNTIAIDVDNTVIRTSGGQTISGDLAITGNLVISGNTITQDVETIVTQDSLIQLAANNAADALDIGFFGEYESSGTKYTALIRDASDSGKYKLLTSGTEKPSVANTVNVAAFTRATLDTNIVGGSVSGLSSAINVADGGTGNTTFTEGSILIGNGTGALTVLANTGTAGTYANASHVPVITTDTYGRVSSVTNTAIAIDASQITSGILGIEKGGTGNSAFDIKGVIVSDNSSTTGSLNALTSSIEGHVLQINSSGIPTFAHLNGGTF